MFICLDGDSLECERSWRRSRLRILHAEPVTLAGFGAAMQDGFPHSIAVVLGLASTFVLALFVLAAWGGFLH